MDGWKDWVYGSKNPKAGWVEARLVMRVAEMKWPRPRFGLRSLLILFAAVATLFAVSQARRRSVIQENAELEAIGLEPVIEKNWYDFVWLTRTKEAALRIEREEGGRNIATHQEMLNAKRMAEKKGLRIENAFIVSPSGKIRTAPLFAK